MITIELADQTITINPPQRLLLLEVTSIPRELDGVLKILHVSGREDETDFELIWKTPTQSDLSHPPDGVVPSLVPRRYLDTIPLVATLRLRDLPAEYRSLPMDLAARFRFRAGHNYSVIMLSEVLLEMTITAREHDGDARDST